MELWTAEHAMTLIPAIAVMLIAGFVLRRTIGDKPLKIRMIPFQVMACIAVLLEIGKQVISFSRGYDLYHIPLHFCSLFIFMLPFTAFYRGKHRQAVLAITAAISTALFALMVIYPSLIYSANDIKNFFREFMSFHTVAFHNVAMFELILMLFMNLHIPDKKKYTRPLIIFTVCFCAAAGSMSQIIKTNFANFYQCNIPPLEAIRLSLQEVLGYVPTQILYVIILTVLHILFLQMCYHIYRGINSLINRKKCSEEQMAQIAADVN